tara:strand:+ start:1510 stop:2220 length:711 start_codon:yes stop_codon:yes gene_type:complete
MEIIAQENIFLSRDYWKLNPSIEQVITGIAEGNSPSELNSYGFDATVYALLEEVNDDTIKYLLSLDGNTVDKRTHDERTYIFWAAYKANIGIMNYLFDKGSILTTKDSYGNTPVMFCVVTGQRNIAVYDLFEKHGLQMNQIQKEGNTLLHLASKNNKLLALESLAVYGIDIDKKNNEGYTALHIAAMKTEDDDILKYLLRQGADKTIINDFGETAFDLAIENELLQKNNVTLNFLK